MARKFFKRVSPIQQIRQLPHVTDLTDGAETRSSRPPRPADPGLESERQAHVHSARCERSRVPG